jgi:hypothetical protein
MNSFVCPECGSELDIVHKQITLYYTDECGSMYKRDTKEYSDFEVFCTVCGHNLEQYFKVCVYEYGPMVERREE